MTLAWPVALVAPALVAFAVIALLLRSSWAGGLAHAPDERSLHTVPTPRIGGLGVLAGALPVAACFADAWLAVMLSCAAFLGAVSFADDRQSLPIRVRLPAHFAAATVAVLAIASPGSGHSGLNGFEAALSILGLVWMTNLFNFMDGSDGLAGGMAVIGFAAFALAAAMSGDAALALVSVAIASASAGFLALNFPPARVFLGDSGSIPLGFLAGALGLHGALSGAWPLWFPILVFSPFIADASVTLAVRTLRGEPFWRAHRGNYYQRLVLGGWTKRGLALAGPALAGAAAASAFLGLRSGPHVRLGIILVWAALYVLLFLAIERRARAN
jgi:UDP-GlcNAc:undecaprenyl-phosphate GlcNAc-1-phosphate transferase